MVELIEACFKQQFLKNFFCSLKFVQHCLWLHNTFVLAHHS